MKSFKKFLKNLLLTFTILHMFNFSLISCAADQLIDEKLLGNMMENLYANMTPAEQDAFAKEIEFQQQKIMQMSPEERDNYEKMMLSELDQLMTTTPELFEDPKNSTLPEIAKPIDQPVIETVTDKSIVKPAKPKSIPIPPELKDQCHKIMKGILQAIDTILLKTNQMHDIMHASWNKGKWLDLKNDLQNLKTYLPMIVNSNKVLAELLSKPQQTLVANLKDFEQLITPLATELKTPDSMGLITFSFDILQIVNQDHYNEAVIKLKEIIDKLTSKLEQTKLLKELKALLDQYAPQQLKAVTGKKPKRPSPVAPTCQTIDQAEIKNQAQLLTSKLAKTANHQLLDLLIQYQKMPSANLYRKLQWKLSELELYLERLVKLTSASKSLNCSNELVNLLKGFDYAILDEIILTLSVIKSHDLNSKLLILYKQLHLFMTPVQSV